MRTVHVFPIPTIVNSTIRTEHSDTLPTQCVWSTELKVYAFPYAILIIPPGAEVASPSHLL